MIMQKMNELYGKRVISQITGDEVATVREVVLDPEARQIEALIISSGRSGDEQVVRMGQILGMGEFIVVDGTRPFESSAGDPEIVELRKGAEQITGKKIMSATGEQFGTVGDMYIGRRGAIVGFELKHGPFGGSEPQVIRATDVEAVGKDAVIARTNQPMALSALTAAETRGAP
jgi:sporulation protein YlmC with PRC-barrel domain